MDTEKRWTAEWIADRDFLELEPIALYHKEMTVPELPPHREELQNRHTLARKTFVLNQKPAEAALDISADDYYKLYINGRFVGQGPAQSGYAHYPYNRYDVAEFLKAGDNVIAVHVYYQGLICRAYNSGDYRQGLIAELEIGGRIVVKTDPTWKVERAAEYANGGVIGYNTQILENIDSRLQQRGWKDATFDDDAWEYAAVNAADDHRLLHQQTPPLAVYEQKPALVTPLREGGFLLDFGSEITGQFAMKAQGSGGTIVEIRCGEELREDGRVRYEMRCNCTYLEQWTLSGEAEDELDFFDYKAFRYVEVLAPRDVVLDPASFRAIVRHYPLDDEACAFQSSDGMLDAIWSICANGVKYGTQENYTDCPSREKGQYLGDNTIIAHAHLYLSGDLRLFRKSLVDFARSTEVCPGMMAVWPGSLMQEIADYSFQWPMQLLEYYKQSGDIEFLRDMLPVAEGMLLHFGQCVREDGLLATVTDKWNLVDWPLGMLDGYDFKLSRPVAEGCHNVVNAFYYGAMAAVRDICGILGMVPACGEARMAAFRGSFRRTFRSETTGLFVDAEGSTHSSLHANALPLLFSLTDDADREAAVKLIKEKRLSCGVYMAYFVLKSLAAAGEHAFLFELIRSEDLHSWGNMVKEGATTCFEAWSKDLKWNTSLCHPWAAAPVPLLIEEIAGLKPASPGWQSVSFTPRVPADLEALSISFRVPAGTIRFSYERGKISLDVPEGVKVVS